MEIVVSHGPSYAVATVLLEPSEAVVAEVGAMVAMDPHVSITTFSAQSLDPPRRRGGCLSLLTAPLRALLSPFTDLLGGGFYQNRFTAPDRPGSVTFAPSVPGDVAITEITESRGLILQNHAFLCSAPTVLTETTWDGARAFRRSEGIHMLRASGEGIIAFNSFGALKEINVEDHYVVDSGHVVAFEDSLQFDLRVFSRGLIKALFGGEARVAEFSGNGRVWVQSRNTRDWGQTIGPRLSRRLR